MKNFLCALVLYVVAMLATAASQTTSLGLPYAQDIQDIVQRGELRVAICADPDFEPFVVANGNQLAGYDVNLSQLIADHLGVRLVVDQATSYDDAIAFVASGKDDIAISNLTVTPERALSVFFTSPYYVMPLVLVAKNNFNVSALHVKSEVVSNQTSLRILGLSNSSYLSLAKIAFPEAQLTAYTDLDDAIQSVKNNQYDAIFVDKFAARQAVAGEPFLSIFELGDNHVDSEAIAVNINHPQLLAWLNAYLASAEGQAEKNTLKRKAKLE